jgi:monoamine oxidase
MTMTQTNAISRRALLARIGTVAGSSVMYQAMTSLGLAAESGYKGPIRLDGDPKGTSVLILGAGIAGLVAALELRKAGYQVAVLEYNNRVGGRCWSLRGGDRYVELGGFAQQCEFEPGLYLNPGPWRIPYHHHAILDYCRRLNVALEPFIQVNYNAYVHSRSAFGGRPQRFREVIADFHGNIAELLAKTVSQDKLDQPVSAEDKQLLLAALRQWGALDANYAYRASLFASDRRGYAKDAGGGLSGEPVPSQPLAFDDILRSRVWSRLTVGLTYEFQTTMFQPVGGMDMIAKAFAREVGDLISFNAKVTAIEQDERGVTATYIDARDGSGTPMTASADWCLCTIPLSILSQISMNVGAAMANAIQAVPYTPGLKIGLQFRRRFWEEDEAIYGGITYTDLPIWQIGYPSTGYHGSGKGVLLGAYMFGPYAFEFTSASPEERVKKAVAWGAEIHPQYRDEYENGIAVGWHRVPSALGCYGVWSDEARARHYRDLCEIDGRIALAGEHASYVPAWQEGAILSALDAVQRLHQRVVAG